MNKFLQFVLVIAILPPASYAADLAILRNGYEIRHEQREAAGEMTRLFLNADRGGGYIDVPTSQIERYEHDESIREGAASRSAASTTAKPFDVHAAVAAASKAHALDPDFIASVIHAESSFNPRAVSPKGAQGLMQLMPATASRLGVKDSFDPNANVDGGTKYLRELLLRYNDDMAKALAAYNAGPSRVDQYRGVPPYRETRQYVARIIREFNQKKRAAKVAAPPPTVRSAKKAEKAAATETNSGRGAGN
ncbi:MAG TPA: lytic transglycosylase domain-containing protein [Terriglobales bacterium]|nr:lytic transglycosylase domain-containing protein [Terriglobales bacterium]